MNNKKRSVLLLAAAGMCAMATMVGCRSLRESEAGKEPDAAWVGGKHGAHPYVVDMLENYEKPRHFKMLELDFVAYVDGDKVVAMDHDAIRAWLALPPGERIGILHFSRMRTYAWGIGAELFPNWAWSVADGNRWAVETYSLMCLYDEPNTPLLVTWYGGPSTHMDQHYPGYNYSKSKVYTFLSGKKPQAWFDEVGSSGVGVRGVRSLAGVREVTKPMTPEVEAQLRAIDAVRSGRAQARVRLEGNGDSGIALLKEWVESKGGRLKPRTLADTRAYQKEWAEKLAASPKLWVSEEDRLWYGDEAPVRESIDSPFLRRVVGGFLDTVFLARSAPLDHWLNSRQGMLTDAEIAALREDAERGEAHRTKVGF